jgi:hypothetical protein
MDIDEAGGDDFARRVNDFLIAARKYVVGGDFAVLDEQIGHAVQVLAWVDDAAGGN